MNIDHSEKRGRNSFLGPYEMDSLIPLLAIACITGGGIVTGLLFAFSNFVMRALAQMPPEQGMRAMNKINETIINPLFLIFFLGTPILCVILAVVSIVEFEAPKSVWLLSGASAYLVGPFLITMIFNVPLNNQLARGETSFWSDYQVVWQRWNHVRTYLGVLSVLLLSVGLL